MRSKRKRYKECFARNTYRIYPLIREIVKSTKVRRLESGSVICENKKVGKRKPVWKGKMCLLLDVPAGFVQQIGKLILKFIWRSSRCGSVVTNRTSIHEDTGRIPGLVRWVTGSGIALNWSVRLQMWLGSRLLWLCPRLAATALIQPLAWELPHAAGAALKKDWNEMTWHDMTWNSYGNAKYQAQTNYTERDESLH